MAKMTSKKSVLVAEDDLALRKALCNKLTRSGLVTFEAKNGEEGFEVALRERPDLILLDLMMPKVDGMAMLKKLRATNEWGKQVPVIILINLASADEQRNKDITELEPSYYLIKTDWKIEDVVKKAHERLDM